MQNGISGKDEAKSFAQRVAATLTVPVKFKEHEILNTVSIGVSLAPENGTNPERLLKSADLALYKSKADGRIAFNSFTPRWTQSCRRGPFSKIDPRPLEPWFNKTWRPGEIEPA